MRNSACRYLRRQSSTEMPFDTLKVFQYSKPIMTRAAVISKRFAPLRLTLCTGTETNLDMSSDLTCFCAPRHAVASVHTMPICLFSVLPLVRAYSSDHFNDWGQTKDTVNALCTRSFANENQLSVIEPPETLTTNLLTAKKTQKSWSQYLQTSDLAEKPNKYNGWAPILSSSTVTYTHNSPAQQFLASPYETLQQ